MAARLSAARSIRTRIALLVCAIALVLISGDVGTQGLDICGCQTIPNLTPFDASNPATYPPNTIVSGEVLTIPLPADGIFKFSSFTVRDHHIGFASNPANTPVTILVAGDVTFASTRGCCYTVGVGGAAARGGDPGIAGVGGLGGPGGQRGGDGANQVLNGAAIGGAGFGPGGGQGGTPSADPTGGQFFGVPELIPLTGGSGGGGGMSASATDSTCSAGGGGGGGGAILIAANGTFSVSDYQFYADGGTGGGVWNGNCGTGGAGGSGGAIRLLASRFTTPGRAELFARGGGGSFHGPVGGPGRIRIEALDTSAQVLFAADPGAQRIVGPTRLANPVAPTVTITSVGGNPVPAVPQGAFGSIDVVVPVPGTTNVDVATSGIPGGTTVAVTLKPRLGAPPVSDTVPLFSCNAAGACQATAVFNIPAGTYVIEAKATFQTPQ